MRQNKSGAKGPEITKYFNKKEKSRAFGRHPCFPVVSLQL